MYPREFFIEDRLEKLRNNSFCNMGESGNRHFSLSELSEKINLEPEQILSLSLNDSPNRGSIELREHVASLYQNINPDQVLITNGTSEAIYIYFHLNIKKGGTVSLFWPAFQSLYEIPSMLGAKILKVNTLKNRNLLLEKLLQNDVNLAILNDPHNPTGLTLSGNSDWNLILEFPGNILFDEQYMFLSERGSIQKFAGLSVKNRAFTGSLGKCFGVTGLRLGWIVAEEKVIDQIRSFKDYLSHTVSPISELIAQKILENKDQLLTDIKKKVSVNRKTLMEFVPKIQSISQLQPPEAGLVCFPKLAEGIVSSRYADELYNNCGVFVLPGIDFEEEGYIRIGLGEDPSVFRQGLERWIVWDADYQDKAPLKKL